MILQSWLILFYNLKKKQIKLLSSWMKFLEHEEHKSFAF